MSRKKASKLKTGRKRKVSRYFLIGLGVFLIFLLIGGIATYISVKPYLSEIEKESASRLKTLDASVFKNKEDTKIYGAGGELIRELNVNNFVYANLSDVSPYLKDGYVAVEDKRFWEHEGIDPQAILRAGLSILKSREITQGGSTITQQLIKNKLLTQEQTVKRKLMEMYIAPKVEETYSKAEILEYYINTNFYGNRCTGAESASRYYFGKSAKDLKPEEAALLMALSNGPSRYDPLKQKEASLEKRNQILGIMKDGGVISESQYASAVNTDIQLVLDRESRGKEDFMTSYAIYSSVLRLMEEDGFNFKYRFKNQQDYNEYKVKYAEEYGKYSAMIREGGYEIKTSLDPGVQHMAQLQLDDVLSAYPAVTEEGKYDLQGAAVVVDNSTGYVLAIVGGRGTDDEYNRGFQAVRQPGSSIKPLVVYAPAFETNRYYPSYIMEDKEIEKGPQNYGGKYWGNVSIRKAVEISINTVAYRILQDIGVNNGVSYLEKMRFSTLSEDDRYNGAVALGGFTNGVRVVDMAKGFSTLAMGGLYSENTCIRDILVDGESILSQKTSHSRIYSEDSSYATLSCLKDVINGEYGTGRRLKTEGLDLAGKTGTTNDEKDGWMCGFSPSYSVAVWVGSDMPKPVPNLTAAGQPGEIWRRIMVKLHEGKPELVFLKPNTVEERFVGDDGKPVSVDTGRKDIFPSGYLKEAKSKEVEAAIFLIESGLRDLNPDTVSSIEGALQMAERLSELENLLDKVGGDEYFILKDQIETIKIKLENQKIIKNLSEPEVEFEQEREISDAGPEGYLQ